MIKLLIFSFILCTGLAQSTKISRADVIQRAKFWTDSAVPYNQSAYHVDPDGAKTYRTDCSGYVSMSWKLPSSMNTRTLPTISSPIAKIDLKSGDIILNVGSHVVIFDKWVSNDSTKYWAYEETPPKAIHRIITYPYGTRPGYAPYRYNDIVDSYTSQCECPVNHKSLQKLNAIMPVYCGYQMPGNCEKDNVYACYYNYRINGGTMATPQLFQTCANGCDFGKYVQPHCKKVKTEFGSLNSSITMQPEVATNHPVIPDDVVIPDIEEIVNNDSSPVVFNTLLKSIIVIQNLIILAVEY